MTSLSLDTSKKLVDTLDALVEGSQFNQNTLSLGQEVMEAWLYWEEEPDGESTAREAIERVLSMKSDIFRVGLTPIRFEKTDLNDRRVTVDLKTAVEWLGCKVMIGYARVNCVQPVLAVSIKGAEFLASLSAEELQFLREITRAEAKKYGMKLTDAECDWAISEQGPDTTNKILSKQ